MATEYTRIKVIAICLLISSIFIILCTYLKVTESSIQGFLTLTGILGSAYIGSRTAEYFSPNNGTNNKEIKDDRQTL